MDLKKNKNTHVLYQYSALTERLSAFTHDDDDDGTLTSVLEVINRTCDVVIAIVACVCVYFFTPSCT